MKTFPMFARAMSIVAAMSLTASLFSVADDTSKRSDNDSKGVAFESPNTPFSSVTAKAANEKKMIFIDFRSPTCGWCLRMTREVYADPSVASAMSSFVSVSYETQNGEGKELAQKFHVQGFPTLVITDSAGLEIDRIEGFRPADAFKEEIGRIVKGDDTIASFRKQVVDSPDDPKARLALGRKLTVAAPAEAVQLLDGVVSSVKGKDRALEAEALISLARAARNADDQTRARAACDRLLAEFSDSDYAAEALQAVIPATDPDAALVFLTKVRTDAKSPRVASFADAVVSEVHIHAAAAALRRRAKAAGDDPTVLNEVAWTSFERKVNLRPAIGWARRAVDLSKREPIILDTLANLLFVTGTTDEALKIEQEALDNAKSEALKSEFGETLAKWKAAVEFRKQHPLDKDLLDTVAADADAEGSGDGDEIPSDRSKSPAPASR